MSVVCRQLRSLRDVLEHMASSNTQDADKAKGLLIAVRQFNFVALCHMIKDVTLTQPVIKGTKEALKK